MRAMTHYDWDALSEASQRRRQLEAMLVNAGSQIAPDPPSAPI